jgi:hypothetical protein
MIITEMQASLQLFKKYVDARKEDSAGRSPTLW